MRKQSLFILVVLFTLFTVGAGFCVNAPGMIVYEKDGHLFMSLPDGKGVKMIAEKGRGPVLTSKDGKNIAYYLDHKIFVIEEGKDKGRLVYQGQKGDKIRLEKWVPGTTSFYFKKFKDNSSLQYFLIDYKKGILKDLGTYFEAPDISPSGKYWVYSTYKPGNEKSEVYGGEPGEKGNYVYHGRVSDVIAWDSKNPVVLYSIKDQIMGYAVVKRMRQIIRLPFKDITVVTFDYPALLYYYNDLEKAKGLKLYDLDRNETKDIIDKKSIYFLVGRSPDRTKKLIFTPRKPEIPLRAGALYLVDTKKGESKELTKEVGKRAILKLNMSNQWSPDGKYFVFSKLKLKYVKIKRSDVTIVGEGKEVRIVEKAGHPVWIDRKK